MADEENVISIEELILDLASSRTDSIPVRKRNDLIQQAKDRLGESADDRRDLVGLDGTSDRLRVGISTQSNEATAPHIISLACISLVLVLVLVFISYRLSQMLDQARL